MTFCLTNARWGAAFLGLGLALSTTAWGQPLAEDPGHIRLLHDLGVRGNVPTNDVLVRLAPGMDAHTLTHRLQLYFVRSLRSDPSYVVLRARTLEEAQEVTRQLQGSPWVEFAQIDHIPAIEPDWVPNDPLFAYIDAETPRQWHLHHPPQRSRDIAAMEAWSFGLTGTGVRMGIVDDGVDINHEDLIENRSLSLTYDFEFDAPTPPPGRHGTSVAGVAAARGGNFIGVTGVAPRATFGSNAIVYYVSSESDFLDAVLWRATGSDIAFDLKNHSYGFRDPFRVDITVLGYTQTGAAGVINVVSAGNSRGSSWKGDANKKAKNNNVQTIPVAAVGIDGIASYYSEFGASLFISAPSNDDSPEVGITTTDITGTGGYDPSNYTDSFGGTSSAAPVVSGVIALMKEVNPALSPRLAKHILARTGRVIDGRDNSTHGFGGWITNAAGFKFNHQYGFGLIDAEAAVLEAVRYSGVSPLTTASASADVNQTISESFTRVVSLPISATAPMEEAVVNLDVATTENLSDLEVTLESPSGTLSRLLIASAGEDPHPPLGSWVLRSNAFWGENPSGTWRLRLRDRVSGGDSVLVEDVSLTIRMGQPNLAPIRPWWMDIVEDAGYGGAPLTLRVRINNPAPAGGVTLDLTTTHPDAIPVPRTITVPEGRTEAALDLQTNLVTSTTSVTVRARNLLDVVSDTVVLLPAPRVTGTVTLGDWPRSPAGVPVRLEVRKPGQTSLLYAVDGVLDAQGMFNVPVPYIGSHDFRVKPLTWLSQSFPNRSLSWIPLHLRDANYLNGDCNGNNSVGITDYTLMTAAWRATPSSPNWNRLADLDGNGTVGLSDYLILTRNWRKNGS